MVTLAGCAEHVGGYVGITAGCVVGDGVVVDVKPVVVDDVDVPVDDTDVLDDDDVVELHAAPPLSGHCSCGLASGCCPIMLPAGR
jgi:hypothetical protein